MATIQELKAHLDIVDVYLDTGLPYQRRGQNLVVKCPDPGHPDNNPSCTINRRQGRFHCFSCQAKGDVIDMLALLTRRSPQDVIKEEMERLGLNRRDHRAKSKYADRDLQRTVVMRSSLEGGKDSSTFIDPQPTIPDTAPVMRGGVKTPWIFNPGAYEAGGDKVPFKQYQPSKVYPYRSIAGEMLGYVMRIEWPKKDPKTGAAVLDKDGQPVKEKFTPQVVWADLLVEDEKIPAQGYSYCSFRDAFGLAPFYGWEAIDPGSARPVIIVEGEKAKDAGHEMLPWADVICWPGGTANIEDPETGKPNLDFAALCERFPNKRFILFPDNDTPGYTAMVRVARQLASHGATNVRIVEMTQDMAPHKWDIADARDTGHRHEQITDWIRAAINPADFADRKGLQDVHTASHGRPDADRSSKSVRISVKDLYDDIIDLKALAQAFHASPRDLLDESLLERWRSMSAMEFRDFKKHLCEVGLTLEVGRLEHHLTDRKIVPGEASISYEPYALRV